MNIAVLTYGKKVIVRPDTTRVKDQDDSWLPEFVSKVGWCPVLYAKVCKSGKCIPQKFAYRYYDAVNVGIFLFPENLMDGSPEGYAEACCIDHTSVLRNGFSEENYGLKGVCKINVKIDGGMVFDEKTDLNATLEKAIERVSEKCWLRIGDFIAVELDKRKELCRRGDSVPHLDGQIGGVESFNFKVIL